MPPLCLQSCPKVYILETHRSKTPENTLRFIEEIRKKVGMLSYGNAAEVDRIGIPVYTCHRIRPDHSLTSHTGKGVSGIQAQVSLSMEAIERYSSEFRPEWTDRLIVGSYRNLALRFNTLDPQRLILSRFKDYDHEREIHWVWGTDLNRREEILVPACTVYHPFHLDEAFLMNTHTNGIAAGNTIEEAVIHGLAEVIERDAWSIAKYNRHYNDTLTVDSNPDHAFIVDIISRFEEAEIELVVKDITTDVGIPVVAAFSRDLQHEALITIDGFGAHLDPRVAMVRSLLEIATTRALFIQKFGIEGMQESLPAYFHDDHEEDFRFYSQDQKALEEMTAAFSDDIHTDIQIILSLLQSRDLDQVIAVDLTVSELAVPTVRVIVPGMEATCFDAERKGDRLMNPRI